MVQVPDQEQAAEAAGGAAPSAGGGAATAQHAVSPWPGKWIEQQTNQQVHEYMKKQCR